MREDWKGILKLFKKLLVVLLCFAVFWGIGAYGFSRNPLRFFDGEIGYFEQNKDFIRSAETDWRVIISGDSAAKCDWVPKQLSDDTYNIALGGASAVENYYYFSEYLENHSAPQFFIYSQAPGHFRTAEKFWSRSVYFHRLDKADIRDVFAALDSSDESGIIDGNVRRKALSYSTYFPLEYSKTFFRGLLSPQRYKSNVETYRKTAENRGQTYYGMALFSEDVPAYADAEAFAHSSSIDIYLRKIIDLCVENGITFIYQSVPINEEFKSLFDGLFAETYSEYMSNLQKDYPDAIINSELVFYDKYKFGDYTHLNPEGTDKFSAEMKNKYSFVFNG